MSVHQQVFNVLPKNTSKISLKNEDQKTCSHSDFGQEARALVQEVDAETMTYLTSASAQNAKGERGEESLVGYDLV